MAAAPSRWARLCSPSTPNAISTTSKSPNRSNTPSTNASCVSRASPSNGTASIVTFGRPRARPRSSFTSASRASGRRAASTTVVARRATRSRTVASAISEPPPRTRTDWTEPSESFTGGSQQPDAAGEIGLEDVRRVDACPHLPQPVQLRVHRRHELGAHPRVLGEVDAPAGVGDEAVEVVEQRRQAARAGWDVERERPARGGERQRTGVAWPESLEHGEERRAVSAAQLLERAANRLVLVVGYDVLVLHEPTAPVHAVPVAHAVERVEEG